MTDATAPTAVAQSVTTSVGMNGRAYVSPASVNNGSTDNCSITNMALSASAFGTCNASAALAFDGSDDYVSLPTLTTSGLSSFTFEAWVNYQDNGIWTRVFDFGTSTNTWMILTPRSNYPGYAGNIAFAIVANRAAGPEQTVLTTTPMPSGWHHLAVTLAPNASGGTTTGTIYLDGTAIGTNAGLTLNAASLGTLARNYLGKSQYPDPLLKGQLDEVRVWSVARTAAQLNRYMDKSLTGSSTGLLAYYDFNDAPATTAPNRGSLGGTATLNNFTTATAFVSPGQVPALGTGAQSVTLTVEDASGNVSTAPATVTVSVPTPTVATWTGSSSTSWTDCTNWQYGVVPAATHEVVVPAGPTTPA